ESVRDHRRRRQRRDARASPGRGSSPRVDDVVFDRRVLTGGAALVVTGSADGGARDAERFQHLSLAPWMANAHGPRLAGRVRSGEIEIASRIDGEVFLCLALGLVVR